MKKIILLTAAMVVNFGISAHASTGTLYKQVTCTVDVNGTSHPTVWNPQYEAYEYNGDLYEASIVLQEINGSLYGSTIVNEVDGDLFLQSGFLPIPSPSKGSSWMGSTTISKDLKFAFFCQPKPIK